MLRPLTAKGIVVHYMDDLIIPSKDEEDGIQRLQLVLDTARDNGLEINFGKCHFLMRKVEFLGFVIENCQIQPTQAKTLAIRSFPGPKTLKKSSRF